MLTKEPQEISETRQKWQQLLTRQIQFALDLIVLVGAFVFANLLRFDFSLSEMEFRFALLQLPLVVLIQFTMLHLTGAHKFVWRYIGLAEMKTFILAALWSALPLFILRMFLPAQFQEWRVPLSIIIIDMGLAFGGVLLLRILRRTQYERSEKRREAIDSDQNNKRAVLLIGAGRAGVLATKEIQRRGDIDLDIKGFVDDDPRKQRAIIQGIKVCGTTNDLPRLIQELEIDHVVITIAQASRQEIQRIVKICERIPIKMRIIPGLYEILEGRVEVSRIRDVQIEDLLGREPVQLDEESIRSFLSGKTVMVTGGGGSIGSELARQIARYQPSCLLLVEQSEFALFNINRELQEKWPDLFIIPLIADVGDEGRMRCIFGNYRPQVVLHAAAHKHVPMVEANPAEAVKNNVLATHSVGRLAGEYEVETFVLISTDKAVRPTSVMGASKRVAELVIQDLERRFATRYVAVRFGNVIGSSGSVIPIFREQIRKGGPITVTHPDMMRYFMTIPEAAQLVLQAGAIGEGGEVFILDMGEPVNIFNLAKDTITLSGLKPFKDINIVFTGIQPGEKLFEELEMTDENITKTRHPKIFIGKIAAYPEERVRQTLEQLSVLTKNGGAQDLRRFLNNLLPEAQLEVADESTMYTVEQDITSQLVAEKPA